MRRGPRTHWIVLAVVLLTIAASQVLYGFSRGAIGRASTRSTEDASPVTAPAGPLLYARDGAQRAVPTPARQVALTFDDGPDPRWTPSLLKVLARLHVPATFFVVGARVLEHPQLVRDEWRAGHDIGLHTYTHTDLELAPSWRHRIELSLSQVALEAAMGRRSSLIRLPYSSTVSDAVVARGESALGTRRLHGGLCRS